MEFHAWKPRSPHHGTASSSNGVVSGGKETPQNERRVNALKYLRELVAAGILTSTALAASMPAVGASPAMRLTKQDMPRAAQVSDLFDVEDLRRSIYRGDPLSAARSHSEEDGWCDEVHHEVKASVRGWYGDGGPYVDQGPAELTVYETKSRKAAKKLLDQVRTDVSGCLGETLQADGATAYTYLVKAPTKLGKDRFAYRVSGAYWGRTVSAYVRKGARILEAKVDADISGGKQRTWQYKKRHAFASLTLLKQSSA